MSDSFVTIMLILIAAVMLFMVPMMAVSHRKDVISNQTVQAAINEFVDTARNTGKITDEVFANLVQTLEATGETYEVNVKINNIDENPSKKDTSSVVDQVKIGENIYYTEYTTQVEKKLEENNGEIKLSAGDYLTVDVENKSQTMYQGFKKFLYSVVDTTPQISGTYGGMILEEDNPQDIAYEEEHEIYTIFYNKNTSEENVYWGSEEWNSVREEQHGANSSIKAKAKNVKGVHRPGYECIGWSTQPGNMDVQYRSDEELPKENTTLYAQWNHKGQCTITYNVNRELAQASDIDNTSIPRNQSVSYDDTVELSSIQPRDITNTYLCIGWAKDPNDVVPTYSFGATTERIKENITLYAIWQTNERATVTFEVNGGEQIESINSIKGRSITLPETTKEGYELKGWSSNPNATNAELFAGNSYRVNSDITLYAVWGQKSYYLDVNGWLDGQLADSTSGYGIFDVYINGVISSSGVSDFYQRIENGSSYEIRNIRSTNAHTYNGVYSGSIYGEITGTDVNVILDFTTNRYTITFNAMGGSIPDIIEGHNGEYVRLPKSTRTGYEFKGWSTNMDATSAQYEGESYFKIETNNILYAVWEPATNTISFDGTGGTTPSAIQGKYDTYIERLPESTRAGYNFAGWATQDDITRAKYMAGEQYRIVGSTTLYAVWEAEKYYLDINLMVNENMVYDENSYVTFDVYINDKLQAFDVSDFYAAVPYGAKYEIRNILPSTGYKFEGMYKGTQTGNLQINGTEVILQITSQKYTLIFNADSGTVSESQKTAYYGDIIALPKAHRTQSIVTFESEGWNSENRIFNDTWECKGENIRDTDTTIEFTVSSWKATYVMLSEDYTRNSSVIWSTSTWNYSDDIILPYNLKINSITGTISTGYGYWASDAKKIGVKMIAVENNNYQTELLNQEKNDLPQNGILVWTAGTWTINVNKTPNKQLTKLRCASYGTGSGWLLDNTSTEFTITVNYTISWEYFVEKYRKDFEDAGIDIDDLGKI